MNNIALKPQTNYVSEKHMATSVNNSFDMQLTTKLIVLMHPKCKQYLY